MGSRRTYSVSSVVGTGKEISSEKAAVTRAIKKADPAAIAAATARLVAKSDKTGDFFVHGLKILSAIKKLAKEASQLPPRDLDRRIRTTWAEVKKAENIPSDPALDRVVLDAAKAALRGQGR